MRFCCRVLSSVHARRCGSVGALCPRFTLGDAVLSGRFASVHACLFSFVRKKETACGILRSCSAGSRSPFVRSRGALRLSAFVGSLRVCAFLYGDLDGLPGTRGTRERGYGAGGAAFVRFCVGALALLCFPRGVRWGCAPQTCAKESSTLWTLFTLRRGYVCAYTRRRHPGTRKDPPGSDLWPGGSGCIEMIPTRSNIQTRAALKRRRVGLRARSGVEAALRLAGRVGLYCDHINTYNRRPA